MITPPSNTGVNNVKGQTRDERLVLEGGKVKVLCAERQQGSNPSGVVVDYLRVTVKRDQVLTLARVTERDDEALTQYLAFGLAGVLGFVLGEARNGRDYYEHTWTVFNEFGKEVASVSGGGASQRDTFCLTLKGEACTFAMPGWERRLYDWLASLDPNVTRIDLARDFLQGEVCIDEVVGHYKGGSFDYRNRRPSYTQHGCWLEGEQGGSHAKSTGRAGEGFPKLFGHARTFQVGQRESGKLLRAYEKGHQFKMLTDAWLRLEVELRNVNRIVPFDALIRPADFFAGAYDFCQMVLDQKPVAQVVPTSQPVGERSVARHARNFENTAAPAIRIVFAALGVDKGVDFLQRLAVKHINRKTPRGLVGLSHLEIERGFERWYSNLSDPVPAGTAPSM